MTAWMCTPILLGLACVALPLSTPTWEMGCDTTLSSTHCSPAGKFLAFSGPAAQPFQMGTYVAHTPEDYHPYFRHKGVKSVVRLNNQVSRFSMRHVRHYASLYMQQRCVVSSCSVKEYSCLGFCRCQLSLLVCVTDIRGRAFLERRVCNARALFPRRQLPL